MRFYLCYQTKSGKVKDKFFSTESAMRAFLSRPNRTVIEWREL